MIFLVAIEIFSNPAVGRAEGLNEPHPSPTECVIAKIAAQRSVGNMRIHQVPPEDDGRLPPGGVSVGLRVAWDHARSRATSELLSVFYRRGRSLVQDTPELEMKK